MRDQFLRLLKNFFTYGIGSLLSRLFSFLLLPLFTRLLTTEDYGVSGLIGTLTVALTGIFSLGTANSLGILFFAEEDEKKRPIIIWTAVAFLFVNGLLIVSLGWLISETISVWMFHTPKYAMLVGMALTTTGLLTSMDPFLAYLRMQEMARTAVLFTLIDTVLTLVLNILFVAVFRWGVTGFFAAALIAKFTMFIFVVIFIGFRLPVRIEPRLVAPLVRIGLPSVLGLFAFLILDYMSRVMLQNMTSIEDVGIFTVGSNFGMIMLLAVGAFGTAWSPFFMSFINKPAEASLLFGRVLKFYLMVFGFIALGFFTFARPVVKLMTAPDFHLSYQVVGLIALSYMLKGCYIILLPGFYFKRKLILQSAVEWLAAISNIVLNLVMIPRYGIQGAAIATCLAYLVLPAGCYFFGRKYLKVHYDWGRIIAIASALILAAAAVRFGDENFSLLAGTGWSLAVLFLLGISILALGLTAPEKQYLRQFIKRTRLSTGE